MRTTGGQEPLFGYLTTLSFLLLGPSSFAMRVVAPVIGLLTVAVTYVLGRDLLGSRAGLISALLIAVSYWHVHESHTSFRAITLPLMAGLTLWLLWRALKAKRVAGFVLAGLSGAATMYTYQSSRVFPVLLAVVLLYLWACGGRTLPWRRVGVFAGVMFALTLPLGWYYLGHADLFFARVDQVGAGTTMGLGESVTNALGMFSYRGDITWKFNLPGKPVFDVWISGFLYLGVLVSLWRWKQPVYGLLLLWVAVMILPTALSTESPHFLRALGIMPAVYILPAVGVLWLVDLVRPRLAALFGPRASGFAYAALAAWLVFGGVSTYRDYFGEWAANASSYEVYNGDVEDASRYLNTLDGLDVVMFSTQYYGHYTVRFFERRALDLRWFDGRQSLPLPDEKVKDVVYVFPASAMADRGFLDGILGPDSLASEGRGPQGQVSFVAYRLTPERLAKARALLAPPKPLEAKMGTEVELLGYQAGIPGVTSRPQVMPGGVLPLTLYWKVLQRASADYSFFSHLVDQQGRMWGQGDTNQYWSSEWRPGDLVIGKYDLKIDPQAPPGRQILQAGVFERKSLVRLPVSGGGDSEPLTAVKVAQISPPSTDNPIHASPQGFGGIIDLVGYDLGSDSGSINLPGIAKPGESLSVHLLWRAAGPINEDYTVFIHLLDASGRLVAQADSQPQGGAFPTSYWDPGEAVTDHLQLSVPVSIQPGSYSLSVGLYSLGSGKRLPVFTGGDEASLGRLELTP
ncbi:MAG: glycosyltransferase family 39 protein [Dehalococcoidia bacterium]|nr:glycosyltransferase family 39 protein [Dehalococcoidia bacterium]